MRRNVLQAMSTNENVNKGIEFNHKFQDDIKFQEFKEGDYHYIDTPNKLQEILRSLYKYSVLGVDLENHQTKSYHGFLCLIQITTPDYQTYLIDCLKLREEIKTYLGAIFESHTTLKIFHGCVNSDITWLQRDFGFATVNVFDTQESYKKLFKGQRVSLLHLWTTYCKDRVKISKEQKNMFQKADWSMRPLSSEMLNYAAHDSHYLIYIAKRLQKNFENQNQLQELADICNQVNSQCVSQLFKPRDITFNKDEEYKTPFRKILDGFDPESEEFLLTEYIFKRIYNLREHLAQVIDVTPSEICDDSMLYVLSKKRPIEYQQTRNMLDEQGKKTTTYFRSIIENLNIEIEQAIDDFPKEIDSMKEYYSKLPNHGWNSQQERMRQKEERKKKIIKHYSCKKVVYENCKMVAPDGELLSNCDFKKAQWYIEKGLGEKISDHPFTIKLMFEPNGRGKAKPFEELYDDNFYVADRENKCVNCGSDQDYSRFHVIPTLYRQNFPDTLKSHRSHDVVLLCFPCHEIASREQDQLKKYSLNLQKQIHLTILKKQLAEKYSIPLNENNPNKNLNLQIQQINRIATTLKKASSKMPEDKIDQFKLSLIDLLQEIHDKLTPSQNPKTPQ